MIIYYFLLDFIVVNMLPICTYFILVDLDKNDVVYVMFISVLLYFIYGNLFFSIFLLGIYFMLKKVNVSNRYRFVKNCLLYLVGFIVGIYL